MAVQKFLYETIFILDSFEDPFYNNMVVVGSHYSLFRDREKTKPPNFDSIGDEGGFF